MMIDNNTRFSAYVYALQTCSINLLEKDVLTIRFYLFEELPSSSTALFEYTVNKLVMLKHISHSIGIKTLTLKDMYVNLSNGPFWSIDAVFVEPSWIEFLSLSDEIKREINVPLLVDHRA